MGFDSASPGCLAGLESRGLTVSKSPSEMAMPHLTLQLPADPAYVVVFKESIPRPSGTRPIDAASKDARYTAHYLDPNLPPAIRALWFCLHLPASTLDLAPAPPSYLVTSRNISHGHRIILIPSQWLAKLLSSAQNPFARVVLICADDAIAWKVQAEVVAANWNVEVIAFSQLGPALIPALWNRIASVFGITQPLSPPEFCKQLDLGPALLSVRQLNRRMFNRSELPLTSNQVNADALLEFGFYNHSLLSAAAALEENRLDVEATAEQLEQERQRQIQNLEIQVALAMPGLPGRLLRHRKGAVESLRGWRSFDPDFTFAKLGSP